MCQILIARVLFVYLWKQTCLQCIEYPQRKVMNWLFWYLSAFFHKSTGFSAISEPKRSLFKNHWTQRTNHLQLPRGRATNYLPSFGWVTFNIFLTTVPDHIIINRVLWYFAHTLIYYPTNMILLRNSENPWHCPIGKVSFILILLGWGSVSLYDVFAMRSLA